MAPFDRTHTTYYQSAIVIMALFSKIKVDSTQGADCSHSNVSLRAGTDTTHYLGLCAHPMLGCWSFLAHTPNWPVALFLLLHVPSTWNSLVSTY